MPPRFIYRLYPIVSRPGNFIRRRYTPAGRLLLGLFVAATLFGIDFSQTMGYQVASLCFGLLATSTLLGLRWAPRISLRRVLPAHVTAQIPAYYWIEVRNDGDRLESDLVVHERLNTRTLSYAEFQRERGERKSTNWFDRTMGFPRWVELVRHARGAEIEPCALPPIAARMTARVKVPLTVRRRGQVEFGVLELRRPDPLGLFMAVRSFALPMQLLSLPRRFPVPNIALKSERRYQKGGISLALAVGDSQEFASLRDYRPGDPKRHIHWRSFAKTGRLIVKEYQDEYFDRHALVVDTHLATDSPQLLESVVSVAASITAGERPHDSILDVIIAGRRVLELSAGRGLGDALQALRYLADVQAAPDEEFAQLSGLIRERAAQLASVILVLGRWDEPRRQLVDDLTRLNLSSISVQVALDDTVETPVRERHAHRSYAVRARHLAADLRMIESPA